MNDSSIPLSLILRFQTMGFRTTPTILFLMNLYYDGQQTQSAVASAVGISTAAGTGIADKLETRGLIARAGRNQKDRRLVFVDLTQAGRDLIDESLNQKQQ